jgi:hypothetical protein
VYRSQTMRRAIAFLTLFSFGFFSLEIAVADVHDGDASVAEIAQVTGAPSGELPQHGPPDSGHEVHVCHCVHAHGTLTPATPRLAVLLRDASAALGTDYLAPATVDLDVHLRPPIARA